MKELGDVEKGEKPNILWLGEAQRKQEALYIE